MNSVILDPRSEDRQAREMLRQAGVSPGNVNTGGNFLTVNSAQQIIAHVQAEGRDVAIKKNKR